MNCLLKYFLTLMIVSLTTAWACDSSAQVSMAEQRLSAELEASVTNGNTVLLGAPEQEFLGIFTETQAKKFKGGIILLHDAYAHADWPDVISPLRKQLTHFGWHTLSLQLPLVPQSPDIRTAAQWDSVEQEIQRRIKIAIDYCRSKRISNLVLMGHQFGAIIASRFVAQQTNDNATSALVTLNLYTPINYSPTNYSPIKKAWNDPKTLNAMATDIEIPFLDIVPSQSSDFVEELAATRKAVMSNLGHDKYRQIHIIGADYMFRGAEQILVSRIQAWLTRLAPSMEVQAPVAVQPPNTAKPR
jgi:alpha/beta superfamily hydrolase